MGISTASIWDIECIDGDLTNYSPTEIRGFCQVLSITPRELFGIESQATAINVGELAALIREHCRSRNITVQQFEDACGWMSP